MSDSANSSELGCSDNDEDSSPECFLPSEPVQDAYDSDKSLETLNGERLVTAEDMFASDVYLWEMCYLGLKYKSYNADIEMEAISATELFTECLKFYFPTGLPEYYTRRYKLKPKSSWKKAGSVLFQSFTNMSDNKWFKRHFRINFSKVTEENMEFVNNEARKLWKFWISGCNFEHENSKAFHLVNHFNKVLMYLCEDHFSECSNENSSADDDNDRNEKPERIKSLLRHMVSGYLNIPTLHNGEGKVNFKHKIDRRENCLPLKVNADITLCSVSGHTVGGCEKTLEEPFGIIQVFDASKKSNLPRSKVVSLESSLNKHSFDTDYGLSEEFHKLKVNNSDSSNVYTNIEKRNDVCRKITSCGPEDCSKEHVADKYYAQLVLQMYGALIKKAKAACGPGSFRVASAHEIMQVLGFFVVNEYVYLGKMNQKSWLLNNKSHEESLTPAATVTFAKDLYFDLKLLKHRLAFMSLLYHYYCIHDLEKMIMLKSLVATKGYVVDCKNDVVSSDEDEEQTDLDEEEEDTEDVEEIYDADNDVQRIIIKKRADVIRMYAEKLQNLKK